MDKPTTTAIFGTLLGIAAGILGMLVINPTGDTAKAPESASQVTVDSPDDERIEELEGELRRLRAERDQYEATASELADELSAKVGESTDAKDRSAGWKKKHDDLKAATDEAARRKDARIDKLEGLLEDNGILEHLSDAEIAARIERHQGAFETAFVNKDKKTAMQALWDLQKLGPKAYDAAIAMWQQVAHDFGLEPFGEGPGELGLNMQEYVSLVSNFGMIEYGLTSPEAPEDFRIAGIYGLPWWSSEDPAKRARLAGDVLLNSDGYEARAAIEALRDINDPATTRYIGDYLLANTDNPDARREAVRVLAQKDDGDAWAAIEDVAENDPDPDVKAAAQQALAMKDPPVAGVLITAVIENYQAALAGIKVGDIMTHYNGMRVKTLSDVNRAKGDVSEGETVDVIVHREGSNVTLKVGSGMIGINGVAVTPKED